MIALIFSISITAATQMPPSLCSTPVEDPKTPLCIASLGSGVYKMDQKHFWSTFDFWEKKAWSCKQDVDGRPFLVLGDAIRGGSDTAEAFAKSVENALVKNPECVLESVNRLDDAVAERIVSLELFRPTYIPRRQISEILEKYGKKYGKVWTCWTHLHSASP